MIGEALQKLVSGGQTGVDRGALDAALAAGFPCGGWCPPGRRAEDGPIPSRYPVTELAEGGYAERTVRNILDSDGTVIIHFGSIEGGTELTLVRCVEHGRPYCLVDGDEESAEGAGEIIARFVAEQGIAVLNVAGPRGSKEPRARDYSRRAIGHLLARVKA